MTWDQEAIAVMPVAYAQMVRDIVLLHLEHTLHLWQLHAGCLNNRMDVCILFKVFAFLGQMTHRKDLLCAEHSVLCVRAMWTAILYRFGSVLGLAACLCLSSPKAYAQIVAPICGGLGSFSLHIFKVPIRGQGAAEACYIFLRSQRRILVYETDGREWPLWLALESKSVLHCALVD
jgi:hypothetical protein